MPAELLSTDPEELAFPFELKKQISRGLRLDNLTQNHVAFKVKTTAPKKYCVRPNNGVIPPSSSINIKVILQAQREAPPDLKCKDKFLIQSRTAPHSCSAKDFPHDWFREDFRNEIYEKKLQVLYVPPPRPPSPVLESVEEVSSPGSSFALDDHEYNTFDDNMKSKEVTELKAKLTELRASITTLNEERNAVMHKYQLLQQQMAESLTSKRNFESAGSGKFSFLFVCIVAIIAFILGVMVG